MYNWKKDFITTERIIILILAIALIAILGGKHIVKLFGVAEFTPIEIKKDTVVKPQQSLSNNKPELPDNSQPKIIAKRKTTVKSGDTTIIVENQPAIVNTGQNSGVMGNNNTINVQPGTPQRHLQPEDIEQLKKVLPRRSIDFYISGFNYDSESIAFGKEIAGFLKSNNHNWAVDMVGQTLATPPSEKLGKVDLSFSKDSSVYFTIYPLK